MDNNVVFSISTEFEMEGRQLKALKPNKDGVYTGIPLAVIGCNSRNNVCYEKESVLQCLTDASGRFASNIASGDMEGEWGHPLLVGDVSLDRLLYIDRTRVSHFFTKVYGKDMGDGIIMIYGDVKPFGPYGKYLEESFQDPTRNTSFSLRSAAAKTGVRDGVTQKKMLALVTFDAVDGPGFLKASKRFRDPSIATESVHVDMDKPFNVDMSVNREQFMKTMQKFESAGMESMVITNQRILDAFGCDKITIREKVLNRAANGVILDSNGHRASLFSECFGL